MTIKILTILVTIEVILLIGMVFYLSLIKIDDNITWIECCNGNQCSDTYYTYKDNLCHLSLCEQQLASIFGNKSQCVYEGANKTLNFTIENEIIT